MKVFFKFRLLAAFAAVLFFAGTEAKAQLNGYFQLGVVPSADSILVSNSLTYTITVTNLVTIDLSAADTVVSNTLPASVQFVSATPNLFGTVTNYGNVTVFHIGGWSYGGVAQMTMTVEPTAAGLITNMVFVAVPSIYNVTNTATTNVVTQVTNLPPVEADLGVAITVPTTAIIANDWMTYSVSVTNAGPSDAPGVMFTNTLPPGVSLLGVLPRLPIYTAIGSNLIFNLGTVSSGTSTSFQFSIQPTNAGVLNCAASVGAPGVLDPNPANNTANNSIAVGNYLSGTLTASVSSTQVYNPQNGLVEQFITVSNAGPTFSSVGTRGGDGLNGPAIIQQCRHQQRKSVCGLRFHTGHKSNGEPAAPVFCGQLFYAHQFAIAGLRSAAAQSGSARRLVVQQESGDLAHPSVVQRRRVA